MVEDDGAGRSVSVDGLSPHELLSIVFQCIGIRRRPHPLLLVTGTPSGCGNGGL